MRQENDTKTPETLQVATIDFYGDEILGLYDLSTGDGHLVIDSACKNLGISSWSQVKKLQEHPVFSGGLTNHDIVVGEDDRYGGKRRTSRSLWVLHENLIEGWLFTIRPNAVKPEVKPKLVLYQKECLRVLHEHFRGKQEALPGSHEGLAKYHLQQFMLYIVADVEDIKEKKADRSELEEINQSLKMKCHALETKNYELARAFHDDKQARGKWARRRKDPKHFAQLWQWSGGVCTNSRCNTPMTIWTATVDHIIPVADGGTSQYLYNQQLLCKRCNPRKGTKWTDYRPDWMRREAKRLDPKGYEWYVQKQLEYGHQLCLSTYSV